MKVYRSPISLDISELTALANFHGIEVLTEVVLEQSTASGPSRGAPDETVTDVGAGVSLNAEDLTGATVRHNRTVRDHPSSALNRLVDSLATAGQLNLGSGGLPQKRALMEFESEWSIAPATDIGNVMGKFMGVLGQDPSLIGNSDIPLSAVSAFLSAPSKSAILLEALEKVGGTHRVFAIVDADHLTAGHTIEDLEGDRAVFGIVDSLTGEGSSYSLDKIYLSGMNRAMRRSFDKAKIIEMAKGMNQTIDEADLSLIGPLVILKSISVY